MSTLINILGEAKLAALLVVLGAVGILVLVVLALRRYRDINRTASRLVELAVGGRADEARILARNASSELAPLLDALVGDVSPPRARPMTKDVISAVLVLVPGMMLALYGLLAQGEEVAYRTSLASTLLLGAALLMPISAAAAAAIISLGGHAGRMVRGSCVTLLARNVKQSVDTDTSEAQRRAAARDPRGD